MATTSGGIILPSPLARQSSDEYHAPAYTLRDENALGLLHDKSEHLSRRLNLTLNDYYASAMGTAAALGAINAASGDDFYQLGRNSDSDAEEASAVFSGEGFVVDVQTHYVAGHRVAAPGASGIHQFIEAVAPDWFKGLDVSTGLSFAEFLRCVFVESETKLAVLTSAPGKEAVNILSNAEIAGTRELIDRLAGSGRLLHHSIVHPNMPGEFERLAEVAALYKPDGFKVYTLYGDNKDSPPWMLDDERTGLPFLQRASNLGVKIICAHKGLSGLAPTGSPADVGPAAKAFPELKFLIYHSGYEVPTQHSEEREFHEGDAKKGTDRLVASLRESGIAPGSNVYAELGSTWYLLMKRPIEAAHVIGKLLLAVGEDNVLWGTDSVWYGPTQPLIDAFRAFHIPQQFQERFGYPALTPQVKEKILGLNAVSVYGINQQQMLKNAENDDLAWIKKAVEESS
ncbi:MAG: putative TIM-barrel fold metal-dependent hydrolase [Halioglobus sp.]|jgi:predicted TIM-barrel fold metal-dependent hydrolase